ncbi:MAG: [citrate (pro-3S)-lyase] ligase [Ruminococcaceae bacterium]|nr:[citrate (pro-3S)-lyase] ligase [Oscillospiraceae bacterium]
MSDFSGVELREVSPCFKLSMAEVNKLLDSSGLKYEKLDYMAALFDVDGKAVACGGYSGTTIKCVAVSEEARGAGLSNKIISHLLQRLLSDGNKNITIFTKPENESMFASFGFKLIERADKAIFMERGGGIKEYTNWLSQYKKEGNNGAVVMNCNPFTNGHLYLVEYAARHCDNLYVFVLSEDKSVFPADVRFSLVEKGVSHLNNVTVLKAGEYIISNATFPSYFLKEYSDVTKAHTQIDVRIFERYIAPSLNIRKRFVGEELFDKVTREYNSSLEKILPEFNMDRLFIIPRKADEEGDIISASRVRKLIAEGDFDKIRKEVPDVTYNFLTSDKALPIIEKIKNGCK